MKKSLLIILAAALAITGFQACKKDLPEQPADQIDDNPADDDGNHPDDFPFEASGTLDWNVACLGHQWVEGKYRFGQMESFTVTDTDDSFYYLDIVDLREEGSCLAAVQANPDAFFKSLQKTIDGKIQDQMEIYGGPLERAMAGVFYKESLDGGRLNFEALGEGDYEFAIFPVDAAAKFTKQYKILSFSHTEGPLAYYPWIGQPDVRTDWDAGFGSWAPSRRSLYINGKAPGVAKVLCTAVTDDYIASDYGNLANFINYMGSATLDYLTSYGYTFETLGIAPAEADGSFSCYISNGGAYGKIHYYLFGFDADGKILPDCFSCTISVPKPGALQWVERKDWAVNYNGDYPYCVVATACDAPYYVLDIFEAGWSEDNSPSESSSYAMEYMDTNGLRYALEEGYAFDSVPGVYSFYQSTVYNPENGDEIYMFGLDMFGYLTGEYHREILTGVPSLTLSLVPEWSVTLVDGTYKDGYVDVTVNAPGIQLYYAEELTSGQMNMYYESVLNFVKCYQRYLFNDMSEEGVSAAEIDYIHSASRPLTKLHVSNPGKESTVYIIEFNDKGYATGRYGATTLTLPQ